MWWTSTPRVICFGWIVWTLYPVTVVVCITTLAASDVLSIFCTTGGLEDSFDVGHKLVDWLRNTKCVAAHKQFGADHIPWSDPLLTPNRPIDWWCLNVNQKLLVAPCILRSPSDWGFHTCIVTNGWTRTVAKKSSIRGFNEWTSVELCQTSASFDVVFCCKTNHHL